ncbi:MAG: immunoglobulin domain-containing protein [Oscillospiraceae bacterium]|nr:immunoglobulin domain-containing protein [Oscillospiraceae bacterium]
MKKTSNKLLALLLALVMTFSCAMPVYAADAKTVDEVAAEIEALSADARDYTAADREMVEGIKADYDALSAEDQAILDERCTHTGTGQPLGRVLESALWTVWSFDEADNTTTLSDGVYSATSEPALSSEYSKGKSTSSRQKPWSVKEVEVRDGKAYATITVESSSYSGIMIYGTEYAKTNTSGNSVFADVPIDLNSTFYFNGVSTSMSIPIAFSLTTTIEESAASEPEHVDLTITNNTGMFKAVTAYLETEDGQTTLVMALSGSGYHELFKGTYEQAVANGDNTDNWIHGAVNADGKWEFRIPVAEDETYIPVVAISNSYYEKYLNGQNSLERAFYPRQMELDREAATLVTGDYEFSRELTVTNNVSMFKVSGAALDTVGGPNSNNYKSTLELTMGSTSFDKAYVGRMSEIGEDTAVIDVTEEQVFSLPVKWVANFGQPETLVNLLDEPFIVSFHSVKNDSWYERQFTVSEAEGTLVIDKVYADYTAVDAALARVPADLSVYTDESVAALQAAIDAVVRDLTSDKQDQVDAMAQAIEDAIAGLEEIISLEIVAQPESFSGPVGTEAVFAVETSGRDLTYRWQFCLPGGTYWNNSGMPGSDTATLSVPVTAARNGQQYRCVITDKYGNTVTTATAILKVTIDVTAQPEDVTAAVGDTVNFRVSATGAGLAYQWQYRLPGGTYWNNSGMTGSNTATLSVPVTASRNGQQYRCVITDKNGSKVISDTAKLTVKAVITAQPKDVTAAVGETAHFTVSTTGAGLTYQWQYRLPSGTYWNNSGMTGSNTATLSVPATAARNGQQYRCVIKDANGITVTTEAAVLTVR